MQTESLLSNFYFVITATICGFVAILIKDDGSRGGLDIMRISHDQKRT